MSYRRLRPFFIVFLILCAGVATAQQCPDCDCYHFPIPEKCNKCCGVATGTITSITDNKVVIEERGVTTDSVAVEKTFKLRPETKRNGILKQGAPATVYYQKEGDIATQVDLTEALTGLLSPADEPDPPLPRSCYRFHEVPPKALRVYLGGNAGYTSADEVTVLTVKGKDLLDVRRTPRGLAVNAKTFSEDGKIIAEIVDNRFYINRGNVFRMERPDAHSIAVYDLQDRKVLDVRYLNTHSVKVLGIFQVPGNPPAVISESELIVGGFHSTGDCFVGQRLFAIQ